MHVLRSIYCEFKTKLAIVKLSQLEENSRNSSGYLCGKNDEITS